MPVHNAAPFLDQSIASILTQSFADFELVLLDDGSTDGSREVLRRWRDTDARIRLVESDVRLGPAGSSDLVVREATARLIARMDADDVALPQRLALQMELFAKHPDLVLLGALWIGIDRAGRRWIPPQRRRALTAWPFSPFAHDTILFRRADFDRIGGYRRDTDHWEDLDLYWRFAQLGRVAVVPEPLVEVRFHAGGRRSRDEQDGLENAKERMLCAAEVRLYGNPDPTEASVAPVVPVGRLRPRVFVSVAGSRVWAGERPRVLSRMLRRMRFTASWETLRVVVWAVGATLSPRGLRWAMSRAIHRNERSALGATSDAELIEWLPREARDGR